MCVLSLRQGDGLIIATSTGSTAYAASAGSSIVHPSVPSVLVTPICSRHLSSQPVVVPAAVHLRIAVSPDAGNTAWASFDGRSRQEMAHGDSLVISPATHGVPCIAKQVIRS